METESKDTLMKVKKAPYKHKKRSQRQKKFNDGPRTHAVTIMLTDREHTLLQQHLRRKKVTNRSKYLRSILLKDILQKLNATPPSLFDHLPPSEE